MSSNLNRSFVEVVGGGVEKVIIQRKRAIEKNGETIISFSSDEIKKSLEPFKWSLVGRFGRYRPNIDEIRKSVNTNWGLKANVSIGILDARHVLLRCCNEFDFMKIWTKEAPAIKGIRLILFPWKIDFDPSQDAYFHPVWISLPNLPVNLFQEDFIASIASAIGKFIKVDSTTQCMARPELARLCVELDVRKQLKKEITIELGNVRRKQKVVYESIPQAYHDFHGTVPKSAQTRMMHKAGPFSTHIDETLGAKEVQAVKRLTQGERRKETTVHESTKEWVSRVFHPKTKLKDRKVWRKKLVQNSNVKGIASASIELVQNCIETKNRELEPFFGSHSITHFGFPSGSLVKGPSSLERPTSTQVQGQLSTGRPTCVQVKGPDERERPVKLLVVEDLMMGCKTNVTQMGEHGFSHSVDLLHPGPDHASCSLVKGQSPLERPICVSVQGQLFGRPTGVQMQGLEEMERPPSNSLQVQVESGCEIGIEKEIQADEDGRNQGNYEEKIEKSETVIFADGCADGRCSVIDGPVVFTICDMPCVQAKEVSELFSDQQESCSMGGCNSDNATPGISVLIQGRSVGNIEDAGNYAFDDLKVLANDHVTRGYSSEGEKNKHMLEIGITKASLRSSTKIHPSI